MSLLKFEKRYYVKIDGRRYRIVQIGRQWWTTSDLMLTADSGNTEFYSEADRVYFASANVFPDEWRMCSDNDIRMLGNCTAPNTSYALRSISGWPAGEQGGDLYCFNAEPKGYYDKSGVLSEVGLAAFIRRGDGNGHYWLIPSKSDFQYWGGDYNTTYYRFPIRLCKDATVNIGGRDYPTTKIGNQIWLAENLDLKWDGLKVGKSGTSSEEPRANYYSNDESTHGVNGNRYGLLYNWPAAKYINDHKKELLPKGWHVPTVEEWDTLITTIGGKSIAGTKLKSTTGWKSGNGDGTYGFSIFPSGAYDGEFVQKSDAAFMWTSSDIDGSMAYSRIFNMFSASIDGETYYLGGYSIRLVKDA